MSESSLTVRELGQASAPASLADDRFLALLRVARQKERLGHRADDVISAYVEATAVCPARAEALHGVARFCRNKMMYAQGYQFAARGLMIQYPKNAPLAEHWIYEYGLLDELAVNAYWIGYYSECLDACERLLQEAKFPEYMRERITANAHVARKRLTAPLDFSQNPRQSATTAIADIRAAEPEIFTPRIVQIQSRGSVFYVVEQDHITQHIIKTGGWEPYLYDFVQLILQDNANSIDLGANFGYHAVGLARMMRNGRLFAFEPLSLCFSQLQMNVLANSIHNVTSFKMAVTDKTGHVVEMERLEATMDGRGRVNIGHTGIGRGGDFTFTVRLDDITFPKIDFIKIDIQGSEFAALTGMPNLISKDRPIIFVEIEEKHLQRRGASSKRLIEHFMSMGYILLRIKNDWPTDHIALPKERKDLLTLCMEQKKHRIDLLSGSNVELKFENDYFYSGFVAW